MASTCSAVSEFLVCWVWIHVHRILPYRNIIWKICGRLDFCFTSLDICTVHPCFVFFTRIVRRNCPKYLAVSIRLMHWKMKNVNIMQSAEWKMKYYEVTFKVISSPTQMDNVQCVVYGIKRSIFVVSLTLSLWRLLFLRTFLIIASGSLVDLVAIYFHAASYLLCACPCIK